VKRPDQATKCAECDPLERTSTVTDCTRKETAKCCVSLSLREGSKKVSADVYDTSAGSEKAALGNDNGCVKRGRKDAIIFLTSMFTDRFLSRNVG